MRKLITAALIPLVALTGPALGDGCRRVSFAPVYHAPVYHAPAYHYDQFAVIAKAVPVYFPVGAYSSVGAEARSYFDTKEAVRLGTLEALREFQASQPGPSPAPVPQPEPPVPPLGGSPKAIPQAKAPAGKAGIKAVLATRCASCHSPKDPDRVDLSGDPDKIPATVAGACATQVAMRKMPKKGEMPDAEYDQLVSWADEKLAAASVSKK